MRPDETTVMNGKMRQKKASEIIIGEIIQLKPGEKPALDELLGYRRSTP
jgi:hypothetical protein